MKQMKKKTTYVIITVIAAVVTVAAICVFALSGEKSSVPQVPDTETTPPDVVVTGIEIDDPEPTETDGNGFDSAPITDEPTNEPDKGEELTIPDEPAPTVPVPSITLEPASDPVEPVTEKTPSDDKNPEETGGIVIGGEPEPYDCGTPGHHCDGPETHAYILNLENEGCPYCGKHDCPSFYAVDEWGNTCYTPGKCPNYDVHKDPVYYCQECGKKCGNGSNGTCVQFVTACSCPICGEHVDSWTCHTCKN
ncbi:MAG: hypothetical protein IJM45_07850 [Clostridia bacterium]|nr:hypothetical protein [Clostridia bacterium]